MLVLAVDHGSCPLFEILLRDVSAWMEVDDGEGLRPAGKGWMRHYAPPEFHLFAAGVEALKELFIVVHKEILVLVEGMIPFVSLGARGFSISSL